MPETTVPMLSSDAPRKRPDLDAIEARAAASGLTDGCIRCGNSMWIPGGAEDDREPVSPHDRSRYIAVQEGGWHGTEEPPLALWEFLAHSLDDVLDLAAEVRRLRAELGTARQCADYYGETLAREAGLL